MHVHLHEALTVDPDRIAVPDYTHLNVISLGTEIISWDKIYIDDHTENTTKEDTHTPEEIEALRISFATGGLMLSEFPPAVVKTDGLTKPYKLVYGFGRSEALQLLKTQKWFFTVLEGDNESLLDVKAFENEQPPKRINKEVDMKKYLHGKVLRGMIPNTEEAIRKKFKDVYPNRGKDVCNRVIQMVMHQADTPQPYYIYTSSPRVKQWIENHSSENIKVDGDWDPERDMYGVQCKEGYQYRVVLNAIKRYRETGKKTYVVGHFGPITKRATIDGKREKFVAEFSDIRDALSNCGLKTWPIDVLGFLPQVKQTDNWKVLVKANN